MSNKPGHWWRSRPPSKWLGWKWWYPGYCWWWCWFHKTLQVQCSITYIQVKASTFSYVFCHSLHPCTKWQKISPIPRLSNHWQWPRRMLQKGKMIWKRETTECKSYSWTFVLYFDFVALFRVLKPIHPVITLPNPDQMPLDMKEPPSPFLYSIISNTYKRRVDNETDKLNRTLVTWRRMAQLPRNTRIEQMAEMEGSESFFWPRLWYPDWPPETSWSDWDR